MNKNNKLFIALGLIILFVSLFLFLEIKKFRSITTKTASEPVVAAEATRLNIIPDNHVMGTGELWIIAYLDLNDAKSRNFYKTASAFVSGNLTKSQLFLKHAPVSGIFSDNAVPNKAAWCAGSQKKLTAFLDALVSGNNVKEKGLRSAATAAKLNIDQWWACTNGEKAGSAVAKDVAEAKQLGLGKPPLIFINNKKINTDLDFDLNKLLNSLLTE